MRRPLRRRYLLACVAIALMLLARCSQQPAAKRYELQGRVVAVDAANHELTIAHGDIPGFMEAMTMPYLVSSGNDWVFRAIGPGDQIHATLVVSDRAELQDISFSKGSDTAGDGTSQLRIPQPGDEVPDFTLINQSGEAIHLKQFHGELLLLTFIYTRCPFPDYCPRMSSNFAQVLRQLQKNPKAFAESQLLSISIDPEHDKPAALRSYGEGYVGRVDPSFQHWQFASGSP
ncbi:MAG: SCO family protein, partial [Candidatus Korobacteraceae bacterium]